jgi:hypothetical protein
MMVLWLWVPAFELVNLLIFVFSDMSQIKDLGPAKTSKFE